MPTMYPEGCAQVVGYLVDAYRANPQAEVPAVALERELDMSAESVHGCLEYLVGQGLAEADLFPINVWIRLTDSGAAHAQLEHPHDVDPHDEGGRHP